MVVLLPGMPEVPLPMLPLPVLLSPMLGGLVAGLVWSVAAGGVPAPGAVLGLRSVCAKAAPPRPSPSTAAVRVKCLALIVASICVNRIAGRFDSDAAFLANPVDAAQVPLPKQG